MPDYDSGVQGRSPGVQLAGLMADLIVVVPTVETSVLDAGDVVCETVQIPNAVRFPGGTATLQTLAIWCSADQGAALDVYILDQDIDLGSLDAAPNITDGNALNIIGRVQVAAADYTDLGGNKVAFLNNLGCKLKAEAGTRHLYLSAVTSGTPTFASASALAFGLGLDQD